MSENTKQETKRKKWREIDQLVYDFRGMSVYDDPMEALRLGTIIGNSYPGYYEWKKWKQEHYVGAAGYDHKTGKIIHPKLREFFDRRYPDFEEQQRRKEERNNNT